MRVAKEVHNFTSACEHLLAAVVLNRPLSEEEKRLIDYYCSELQSKLIAPPTS
jgi:nitrogenase subunit NifH